MTWPQATDYNAAVQNPQLCFRDEDLRQGQAAGDLFGLPRPHSGNFADVYQIQDADDLSWAVKCFTRPVAGLHRRYHAISEHLRQTQRAFMVEFHFLDEGICIHGQWYPLVKMRWVEGFRLNEFIREHVNKPVLLDRLSQMWIRLAQELRDADMAHGDLQHGNVLLVPGSKSSSLALRLIDYDGMYVPALADRPSAEVGHPNYQHPQRLREGGYHRHMDRFAHLLIYTALHCTRVGGEDLWQRYDNMENLLFREEDFRNPGKSHLLRELWDMKDRDTRYLVGHLLLASQGPLRMVPVLDDLLDTSGVRPLSDGEEARINDLLDDAVYGLAENAKPRPAVRRGATVLAPAAPAVRTVALTDTQPIDLNSSTQETPVLPPPRPQRRSFAEIDLDAQPPEPLPLAKQPFDTATLADPLVSVLSRPGWLALLGVVALVGFLAINVLVWSSVKQPERTEEHAPEPAVDKADETIEPGSQTPFGNARRETPFRAGEDEHTDAKRSFATTIPKQSLGTRDTADREPTKEDSVKGRETTPKIQLNGKTPSSLSIEAGEKSELHVFLDRNGYRGEMTIHLVDLPEGVMVQPVVVPAENDSASVSIETNVKTKKGKHVVHLLVRGNGETLAESSVTLTVEPPHGWQEIVHFPTVDHMELAGTLYHGWKGKNGMTVLMLHDLGRNRRSLGWRRLAEALQAEGHTVLTFDFRGHGDSTKVSPAFWKYPVNKNLLVGPEQKKLNRLEASHLPTTYTPWLIEDIAAARTYLDLCHDEPDGPVNTFNLVLLGAGQSAALGSCWLATEGVRFNAIEKGKKIEFMQSEKLSVRQAVWLGMADPLKFNPFGVHTWLRDAHAEPPVPITFVYGKEDPDTSNLLAVPIREKLGEEFALRKTRLAGQDLVERDPSTARLIQHRILNTLKMLPPVDWRPRHIKKLGSYWLLPVPDSSEMRLVIPAKHPGQEMLSAVPMRQLRIPVIGAPEVKGELRKLSKP